MRIVLLFIILFSCAALRAQSTTYDELIAQRPYTDKGFEALTNGKNDSAIYYYTKWLAVNPQDNDAWYNLACAYAKIGNNDLALEAWLAAAKTGFKDKENAQRDPDLSAIRNDPRFAQGLTIIDEKAKEFVTSMSERRIIPMQAMGTYLVLLPPDYNTSKKQYHACIVLHGAGLTEIPYAKFTEEFGREDLIYIIPRAPYPSFPSAIAYREPAYTAYYPDEMERGSALEDTIAIHHIRWIRTCLDDARKNYRISNKKILLVTARVQYILHSLRSPIRKRSVPISPLLLPLHAKALQRMRTFKN